MTTELTGSRHFDAHRLALLALVVIGAWLRFSELDSRSFWKDESYTIRGIRLPMSNWLDGLLAERSPPAYYLFIKAWGELFGLSEAALRFPSALAGTLTILVAFAAARLLVSRRAGLAAAAITATSPMLVWFSLDARPYAFLVLFCGLSFLYFIRWLLSRRDPQKSDGTAALVLWAVFSALAIATHYFAAFLIAPEFVWIALSRPRRLADRLALGSPILMGATMLPLAIAQRNRYASIDFIADLPWWPRLAQIPANFLVGFQPPSPLLVAVLGALVLPVLLWSVWQATDPTERRALGVSLLVGGGAFGLPLLISVLPGFDYLMARNVAGAFVPFVVFAAVGLAAPGAGWLGMTALTWLCALGIVVNVVTADVSKFEHEDWRGAAAAVGSKSATRAILITPSVREPFQVYRPDTRVVTTEDAVVEEIVLVALPPQFRKLGQESFPPRPPAPAAPAGFALVEHVEAPSFTLVRFRADDRLTVPSAGIEALALGAERSLLLLEEPSR